MRSTSAPRAARCARRSPASSASSRPRCSPRTRACPPGAPACRHAARACSALGELERIRDDLADRVAAARADAVRQGERQAERRLLIERMLLDPGAYKWVRVTNADIGEPGCKNWHVVPRLGHRRHAGRLVARQDLLGLPVSHLTASL